MGRIALVFAIVYTCLPDAAEATLVEAMEIEEMAYRSSIVVRGEVETKASTMENGRISTQIEIAVARGWTDGKRPSKTITVVLPGGQFNNLAQTAAGLPEFSVGDEVLLFLWSSADVPNPVFRLLGLSMGHFRIERGGEVLAISDRRGIVAIDKAKKTRQEGQTLQLKLEALESRIDAGVRKGFKRFDATVRKQ